MSVTTFSVNTRKIKEMSKHHYCVGVYLKRKKDGSVELRCFDRTHGGNHIFIAKFVPESEGKAGDAPAANGAA